MTHGTHLAPACPWLGNPLYAPRQDTAPEEIIKYKYITISIVALFSD